MAAAGSDRPSSRDGAGTGSRFPARGRAVMSRRTFNAGLAGLAAAAIASPAVGAPRDVDRLDAMLDDAVARGDVPGLVAPDDIAPMPGRFGWWGGFGTTFFVDPHTATVAVLFTQRMMGGPDDAATSEEFLRLAFRDTGDGRP